MSCLIKIISSFILILFCIVLIFAQAPELKPPAKRSFKHGTKIFQEYIQFANATLIKSKNVRVWGKSDDSIEMTTEFSSLGKQVIPPKSIVLAFISSSKAPRYDFSTPLSLYLDGEELQFSSTKRTLFVIKGSVLEAMVTPVPYQTFLRIANAQKVRVKLGISEFELKEKYLEILRDVVSRTVP